MQQRPAGGHGQAEAQGAPQAMVGRQGGGQRGVGPRRETHRRAEQQQGREFGGAHGGGACACHADHCNLAHQYTTSTVGQITCDICTGSTVQYTGSRAMLMKSLFAIADRAAVRPLCRAHPRPPAGARRAPAVGAPVRAAAGREPVDGGGRVRPAAGAGPGGGAQEPRLLRAREPRRAAQARRAAATPAQPACGLERRALDGGAARSGADRRDGADPRHVPQGQRQAAAGHGRVPARLAGIDLHAGGRAQGDQHARRCTSFRCSTASRWATAGLRRALSQQAGGAERARRAGQHHHHRRRHACAGHRQPHAAARRATR